MDLKTIHRIFQKGEHARAEKHLKAYIKDNPKNIGASYQLANVFLMTRRLGLASDMFQAILDIKPDFEAVYNNAIVANKQEGRLDRALALCEQAAERFAGQWEERHLSGGDATLSSNILANWGAVLLECGEPDAAQDALNFALKYNPKHIDAKWNRGLSLLVRKRWQEGFAGYEYGFAAKERQRRPYWNEYPHWDGKDPKGKKILVWGEQGLGDEILFAQCLRDLHEAGAEILFDCHPRLVNIFQRSFPFRCEGQRKNKTAGIWDGEAIDGQVPLGSLPLYFRKSDGDFLEGSYLKPHDKWVDYWKEKAGGKLRIGLSWKGGPHRNARDRRSMPLEAFSRFILPYQDKDISFVSLQYGEGAAEEVRAFNVVHDTDIEHYGGAIDDYTQTADLAAACDLIISVITAVVHLGGAMGRPVWCLVPQGAPWKFTSDDYMIWHPSVRQYHQESHYIWEPVLSRISEDLEGFINERL